MIYYFPRSTEMEMRKSTERVVVRYFYTILCFKRVGLSSFSLEATLHHLFIANYLAYVHIRPYITWVFENSRDIIRLFLF